MDIHKPKPWHGLREFLKEYLIIVVGVLTAFGAEQVAEWAHWSHETQLAREALSFDLRKLIGAAASKDASMPCVAERLGTYSDVLDQAQTTGRLPPIGFGGWPPAAGWSMGSWDGLTSGQTLAHMSNRDQITLSGVVASLGWLRTSQYAERDAWGVLKTMAGPGRPISESEIATLRAQLGRASFTAADQRAVAQRLESAILRSGFLTRAQVDAAYQEGVAQARKSSMCLPPLAPAGTSRDALTKVLTDPPVRPGDAQNLGVGVHGALTTEH